MSDELGLVFDRVPEEYERGRRGYPRELVEAACEIAALRANSHVVGVGCGTGKLTRVLAERGLRIEAIDPSAQLVRVAQRHVEESAVQFHVSRFEDLELPASAFAAVFAATAFHWVDPAVGWSKVARLLRRGGVFVLLTHTIELDPEMLAAWREVLPEAGTWVSRDVRTLWEGAEARMDNVSELWAWLVKRDIGRPEAATLFGDVQLRSVKIERTETVAELLGQIRTQSAYLRLDVEGQLQLEQRIKSAIEKLGGTHRSEQFAVLVTARRA
jgi:ubiquinone/menaquinone biosynthesis C-methylase UbiE